MPSYVGSNMKTQVRTVMVFGNLNNQIPVSTYTSPNGATHTFRGGNSEKILRGVQAVEDLRLSKLELQILRTLLDNL